MQGQGDEDDDVLLGDLQGDFQAGWSKQRRAGLQGGQLTQPHKPREGFEFCPVEGGAVEGPLLADK